MSKFKITNKGLYWGLIATFIALYALVAFVSTLHAIDFFRLANIGALAILLGIAYEVGQATVLFSILMTKNKEKFLPWILMILLTALQVTANVYASFKHMSLSGNDDWTYWYTSILKIFGVQGGNAETYQVIISWISGALLPIVALGMTALVAQNIKLITEDGEESGVDIDPLPVEDEPTENPNLRFVDNVPSERQGALAQEEIDKIRKLMDTDPIKNGSISENIKKVISPGLPLEDDAGNSPREQISREVNNNTNMDVEPPLDLTQFKSPRVFTRDGDPRERGEELPPKDDLPFPVEEEVPLEETQEFKDFVDNILPVDEEISKESVIAPQPVSNDMGEMTEPLGEPVEADIKPEIDFPFMRMQENKVEPPKSVVEPEVEVEPTPPVKYERAETVEETKPPEEGNETEEERQERLRNIAREKLKKK